jgi:hypothetical protein
MKKTPGEPKLNRASYDGVTMANIQTTSFSASSHAFCLSVAPVTKPRGVAPVIVAACTALMIDKLRDAVEQPPCGTRCRGQGGALAASRVERLCPLIALSLVAVPGSVQAAG